MPIPVFPPELPRPERRSHGIEYGDGRRWSERDGGPDVPRPGWSAASDIVALTFRLTRPQLARFDRFRIEETARGLKPFLMRDPGLDGWPAYCADGSPMLMADGSPVLMARTWLCLLTRQRVAVRPVGVLWDVSFQVAVMP